MTKLCCLWRLLGLAFLTGSYASFADGLDTWAGRNSGTTAQLLAITYGHGASGSNLFATCGSGGVLLTSPTGLSWAQQNLGATNLLKTIASANGIFVVAGWCTNYRCSLIASSGDAATWTSTNSPDYVPSGVTYGQGLFALGGTYGVSTSPDGLSWTEHSLTEVYLDAIAFGGGRFVGVSDFLSGSSVMSTNATNWNYQNINWGKGGGGSAITYGKGVFIVTDHYRIRSSADGVNWTNRFVSATNDLYGIAYGVGTFVAVGKSGAIFTSTDGLSWRSRRSGVTNSLRGITYGNGSFVAVGDNGTIIQSGLVFSLTAQKQPDGGLELSLTGEVGRSYRIQVSTDLKTWTDFVGFTSTEPVTTIADLAAQLPARFYRAVSP